MGMVVNPSRFAVAGGSAIDYKTAEDLAGSTMSSTTFASVLSLTVAAGEQAASAKYALLWSVECNVIGAVRNTRARVTKGGVAEHAIPSEHYQGSDVSEFTAFGGIIIHDAGATPSSTTFAIEVARGASATTLTWRNARLTILKLGPDDYYAESTARQTTSATTLQTAATLSFTPAISGDYIILSSFHLDASSTANLAFAQMSDGTTSTTEYGEAALRNASSREPWVVGYRLNSVSGSKSVTTKYRASAGITAGISEVRMLALRLDRFANAYTTVLGADNTGTETTPTTGLSQTFTPAAAAHLSLALLKMGISSTGSLVTAAYDDGGVTVGQRVLNPQIADSAARSISGFTHRVASYAAASRTQALKRTASANTASLDKDSAIFTLDLTGLVAG